MTTAMTRAEAVRRLNQMRSDCPEGFYADGMVQTRKIRTIMGRVVVKTVHGNGGTYSLIDADLFFAVRSGAPARKPLIQLPKVT